MAELREWDTANPKVCTQIIIGTREANLTR